MPYDPSRPLGPIHASLRERLAGSASLRISCGLAVMAAWLGLFVFLERTFQGLLPGGVFFGILEVSCSLAAAGLISRRIARRRGDGRVPGLLAAFFAFLAFADGAYCCIIYVLRLPANALAGALLATLPYTVAFALAVLAMWEGVIGSLRGRVSRAVVALPLALSLPVLVRFLMPAIFTTLARGEISGPVAALALLNTVFSFALINASVIVFLSVRGVFWPMFSVGTATLILANWALSTEVLLGWAPVFGFYEYLWGFGVLLCAAPILIREGDALEAGPPEADSLVVQSRLVIITVIAATSLAATLSPGFEHEQVRLVAAGLSFGFLAALLASQALTERISFFASEMGRAMAAGNRGAVDWGKFSGFPIELREVFERMFANEVAAQRLRREADRRLAELAAQVAHDVRSPLAALDSALQDLSQLPEEKRGLVRGAVGRIREIADDLLERNRGAAAGTDASAAAAGPEAQLLSGHIEALVEEKRLQFRSRKGISIDYVVDGAGYGLFSRFPPAEFKRVLSNLINNGVESLGDAGTVVVRAACEADRILLTIQDDGKGIPPDVLARLGRRGETHGKAGGSGLGLHHARASVESWGGSLEIRSEPGKGTTLTLSLPRARPPGLVPIAVGALDAVLLDDDALTRKSWEVAAKSKGVALATFGTLSEFWSAVPAFAKGTPIYLDSELGGGRRGEDVAKDLRDRGFMRLFLATGHDPQDLSPMPWIERVVGKEPPWSSPEG